MRRTLTLAPVQPLPIVPGFRVVAALRARPAPKIKPSDGASIAVAWRELWRRAGLFVGADVWRRASVGTFADEVIAPPRARFDGGT